MDGHARWLWVRVAREGVRRGERGEGRREREGRKGREGDGGGGGYRQ